MAVDIVDVYLEKNMTQPKVAQYSTRHAWFVVLIASLFFFYEFIQMNMFSSLDIALMHAFAISATKLGNLSSIYFIANVIFLFPAGLLLDRFSTKKIMLYSLSFCFIGTWAFSLTQHFYVAMFYRFLTGIGSAFCFLCCIRLASRWFLPKQMALVTGVVVTVAMIGGMVAQTPLMLLVERFGWREALRLDASLGILIFVAILVWVQDYPCDKQALVERQQQQTQQLGFWHSVLKAILVPHNWLVGLYVCFMNLPIYLLGAVWGTLFLQQGHYLSPDQASVVTSMIFLGTIIGSPMAGYISDKIARRRLPMVIGTIASLCVFLALYLPHTVSMGYLMLVFFLLGFVTSTQVLGYPLVAETNDSALTASAVSVVSTCVIGGGAVFQPLFGLLMDRYWQGQISEGIRIYNSASFEIAMLIMPITMVACLLILTKLRESFCCQQ